MIKKSVLKAILIVTVFWVITAIISILVNSLFEPKDAQNVQWVFIVLAAVVTVISAVAQVASLFAQANSDKTQSAPSSQYQTISLGNNVKNNASVVNTAPSTVVIDNSTPYNVSNYLVKRISELEELA
ncbi:MAG TPA: hypothetical protein VHO69_03805, partial [Phototrophicaceae bacterium]|nr:hypothetical protein [Phototrophicaceae bacterium]